MGVAVQAVLFVTHPHHHEHHTITDASYCVLCVPQCALLAAGGCLVIHGQGTDVTLSGVSLDNCSIVVVAGAKATLLQCACVSAEVALFAAGKGTTVEMRGCEFVSCRQGVCVDSGACVSLLGLRCTQSTITCVEARGVGTKVCVLAAACDVAQGVMLCHQCACGCRTPSSWPNSHTRQTSGVVTGHAAPSLHKTRLLDAAL